jgi:hypothetical protein
MIGASRAIFTARIPLLQTISPSFLIFGNRLMNQEENTTNTSAPPAPITPTKAIKKVLPNQMLAEGDIEQFMVQLKALLEKIDLEENAKNPLYDFLMETH